MSIKSYDENKYYEILKLSNKDTPIIALLLLFIKAGAFENEIFYFFTIFFRFLGLLIISGNFNNGFSSKSPDYFTISYLFRIITSYGLIEKCKITNLGYIIISFILFFLLLLMIFFYVKTIIEIKYKINLENISINKIQILLEHLCFLLFPYIIEFLSFIFYIQFLGDKFIIKKNADSILNITILVLNSISMIGFNIQSFLHILSFNNPISHNNTLKLNYGRNKLIIISFIQNIIIIESLSLYFSNNILRIYKIILNVLVLIILIMFYLYSFNNYNYDTKTNYFINFLSNFCFFSTFLEIIFKLTGYKVKSNSTLFFYSVCKIIVTFCFDFISNKLHQKRMINILKIELFKIYNDKTIPNINYNCYHYFNELYKNIYKKKGEENIKKIINIIILHQSKCHSIECKCKCIQIYPYGKQYINKYKKSFLERINFLLESTFVELDYQKYYDLSLLLAEHYYNYKDNPFLSYSIVQTILFFNVKLLNINQIIILFTALDKYIAKCNDNYKYAFVEKTEEEVDKDILTNKKRKIYKNIFNNYKYLMKIKKIIKKYASDYLTLVKYKENMEETIHIIKDDNNDIIKIISFFLTTQNLSSIMNILLGEITLHKNLIKYLRNLDSKIPIGLIYKCILFSEFFLCGKVPSEVVSLFYSINSDINLYQQNLLSIIEYLYRKNYMKENSYYYLIFKFSNGINIQFFDEILSKKLGFSQKELSNASLDYIIPKELRIPHNCSIIRNIINDKNKSINNKFIFIFDRDMQMHPIFFSGICIPGLGKYLFCISKLCLKNDKNEYYFYLGKNFECISLSYTFYKNYHITLSLLNKYKINILDLLDFNFEDLGIFNKDIIKINKYKHSLDMITDYFYAQKVFREKSRNYSGQNNFYLISLMKKKENYYNEETIELKNDNSDEQQNNIIDKIINVKNQYIYLKKHLTKKKQKIDRKMLFDKIEELLNKYNENDQSIQKLISLSSTYINNIYENKSTEKIDLGYFEIEYNLTLIYNTYFYFFKMKEISKDIYIINQNINNFVNHKNDLISNDSISRTKTNERISIKQVNNKNINNKKEKKFNDIKISKVKCYNQVIPLAILVLGILLIIYVIILVYQRNMVTSSYNGFLVYFYNYNQRDKLYTLYSVLLSSYFYFLNMTNFNNLINENDYKSLIEQYSIEFQEAYHKFYEVYVSNTNHKINEDNVIFKELDVYKIFNYYKQSNVNNNYIKESEYLGYISRGISINYNLSDIIEDSISLYCGTIFEKINGNITQTKSYYIQTLYYISKNYHSLFKYIYTDLEEETTSEFLKLSKNSKMIYLLVEILGFIIIGLFYVIVLLFLYQTNTAIFNNIVNMFINNNEKDNFHYRNKKDNYYIIKIITSFITLISDFNLDNINKFQFIINGLISKSISMDSTFDIKDNTNTISFDLIDIDKNKKDDNNINKNKKEKKNQILDYKNNNDSKVNLSSSKIYLKGNTYGDTLNNLNNPQNATENTINTTNNNTTNTNIMSNKKLINNNKSLFNESKKIANNNKNAFMINNEKSNKTKINYSLNDEERMTMEIFLQKLVNSILREIKISLVILLILSILLIIYATVKVVVSLNFITEIKEIFEDFGVLSYVYSYIYYYFNSLRTVLVFPNYGNEKILKEMQINMSNKIKQMERIINTKLDKYPSVQNYYRIIGADTNNPKPSPSYINATCYNQKCIDIINNKNYNILSEGLKMTITSMNQLIINIYEDYKKHPKIIKEENSIDFIKEKFINNQYEQLDINLNYVVISIEKRIYEAFMIDVSSLAHKYNSIIEALNICAVIYCFIVEFITLTFIIFNLRTITQRVEEATLRINKALRYMIKKNINNDKEDNSSLIINSN